MAARAKRSRRGAARAPRRAVRDWWNAKPLLRWLAVGVAVFAIVVFYCWGAWQNPFYKDDHQWIADAMDLAANPGVLFKADPDNTEILVRPFQRILLAFIYAIRGKQPAAFCFLSLVLHSVATLLVLAFVRTVLALQGMSPRAATSLAWGAAFFFLLSRTHYSAVLWISALSTIQVTIVLTGLSLYILRHDLRRRRQQIVVAAGFLLALYTKSVAVAFPLAYPFLRALRARREDVRRVALETAVLALMGVGHAVFTKGVIGGVDVAQALTPVGSGAYRLSGTFVRNAAAAITGSFLLPGEYHALAGRDTSPVWGALIVLGVTVALGWVASIRRTLWLGFAWMLALGLPTSLFSNEQYSDGHITVSRYYYPGLVGTSLWLAAAAYAVLPWLARRIPRRAVVTATLILALVWAVAQSFATRYSILWFRDYGIRRYDVFRRTMGRMAQAAPQGGIVYCWNWKDDDTQLRSLGRLFLRGTKYQLLAPSDLVRLAVVECGDGVARYLSVYDDSTQSLGLYAIPGSVERSAADGARNPLQVEFERSPPPDLPVPVPRFLYTPAAPDGR